MRLHTLPYSSTRLDEIRNISLGYTYLRIQQKCLQHQIQDNENIQFDKNIILSEPLGLIDYYKLQQNSLCVISDSGTVTEESKILGFKAVLLRTSTEHPEGIDAGSIILGSNEWKYLQESIKISLSLDMTNNNISNYNDLDFSEKVCKIISGYTGIINKFIWMK